MNKELLILFISLTIINVVIQTIKNITTIKCGKTIAALISAFGYGFQTIVTIYTLCELPLLWKAGIVAVCNLIGVYFVKWGEEKARKDKLWKIECTIPQTLELSAIRAKCEELELAYNFVDIGKYYLFNFYCPTKADSRKVKEFLKHYPVKYFVSENTSLS